MVKINNITKDENITCNIFVKCEFMNPFGSIKDRISYNMFKNFLLDKKCQKGDSFIEATSGNTGISLAAVCAIFGYQSIITMPIKMSKEKRDVLNALNAKIYRTPSEAAFDSPESHLSKAFNLHKQLPNSHILDQYRNPYNSLAHFDGTAEEILYQMDNNIDYLFIAAGTGGTLSGISRKIKEKNPNTKIIGIDPNGSILAMPQELNEIKTNYQIEGIGYDFVPMVCNRKFVDEWVKSNDVNSFKYARKMISKEGLLVGGSSGAILSCAIKYIKDNNIKSGNIVIIAPDSIRNYLTKFIDNNWLFANNIITKDNLLIENQLSNYNLQEYQLNNCQYINSESLISQAHELFKTNNVLYTKLNNKIRYMTKQSLINNTITLQLNEDSKIIKILEENTCIIKKQDVSIQLAQQLLQSYPIILVENNENSDVQFINQDLIFDWLNQVNFLKVNIFQTISRNQTLITYDIK